jgi:putative transposase
MTYDPLRHHRRSIRLDHYDYSKNGAYFITVCTFQREHLFGEVADGIMRLNEAGQIVEDEWCQTARVRPYITLDAFVVMPNHFHGLFVIEERAEQRSAPTELAAFQKVLPQSVPSIVLQLKGAITKRVNALRNLPGTPVWQRNYHEHIVRGLEDLDRLRRYIEGNPGKWSEDRYYS